MAKALKVDPEGDIKLAQPLSYTKHYYIGSERVSAKTGSMDKLGYYPLHWVTSEIPFLNIAVQDNSAERFVKAANVVASINQLFGSSLPALNTTDNFTAIHGDTHDLRKLDIYYFHPDHLGSSSYITNMRGMVSQHMEYLPFGELLVDEHKNSYNSPFKYNGKEFDEETGNYFYGARYYDPKWSIFISVDPLAEDAPDWTPYRYGFNNPIRYTDPTGMYEQDDIIIRGSNDSSITIVTDLIDIEVNAGSIIGDIGGNYTLQGDDVLIAALDIVGVVDPTGVADVTAATLEAKKGNWGSAILSGLGVVPLIGDLGKVGKIPKHLKTIEKAIDGAKNGRKAFGAGLDTQSKTSKQAFNRAKDQNGIPRSQQPDKQYTVPDKNTGKPLRQYEYTNSKGEKVNIRKDNPVKYPDGGKQGPHYNAGQSGEKLKQHHNYE